MCRAHRLPVLERVCLGQSRTERRVSEPSHSEQHRRSVRRGRAHICADMARLTAVIR